MFTEHGRPVALRPEVPSLACAALVVQALYFVPQVRFAVGKLRLPDLQEDIPINHPGQCGIELTPGYPTNRHCSARGIWNLIELFTNMDLAKLSTIVDVEVLPSLEDAENRDRANDHPAERATCWFSRSLISLLLKVSFSYHYNPCQGH